MLTDFIFTIWENKNYIIIIKGFKFFKSGFEV